MLPLPPPLDESTPLGDLAHVIQAAVAPVVLISGVGLLLLTMTNRLGRIVDRARALVRELPSAGDIGRMRIQAQLQILIRRARLVRLAVTLASASVLLAGALVAVLFVAAVIRADLATTAALIFASCMVALIASMLAFIREIHLSLHALELEIGDS